MDSVTLFRQQLKEAHEWLEVVMQGVTPEQLHWKPAGKANPISASYAHVIMGEDFLVNAMLKGGPPLAMTAWAGKTGLSEMPPADPQINWFEWGRKVKVDLPAIRKYAQAVWSNSDSYLASLKESDLTRKCDTPMGPQTILWLLNNALIGHVHDFTGEISCLKGLQGLKGYPV